jgi:hypothetical protein
MFRVSVSLLALAILTLCASTPARADRRAFLHTYEYQTMAKGGLDLEIWNTQTRPSFDSGTMGQDWRLETEYGITDHWDLAIYQNFAQAPGMAFGYDSTSVETRYRIGERGDLPVDVLVYAEVVKPLAADELEVEGKLILAKDIGPLTLAINLIAEVEFAADTEFVPGWAVGLTWEVAPAFKIGVETFGERSEVLEDVVTWIGPSISWSPSPRWWLAAGASFGITTPSDDFIASFIIGITL